MGYPATRAPRTDTPTDAVRLVIILLFVNLALAVAFAGLTLLFRESVLDYQLAARAPDGQSREQLALTLWTRPIPILLVGAGYLWIARRLRQGRRGAYLRVRMLSLLGLVAVAYLILSGEYPAWLRVVQGVQLLLLAVLVVAVNRRPMRAAFARSSQVRSSETARRAGGRRAALTLALVAPVVAELTLGTVPLTMIWLVLLYVPMYGAGVLLVRELVRATGGGWPSVLLMGLVYGLVEEGLALQSLTSPHLYGAAGWAPRLLGVNTAYTELNLPYHVLFSVVIPIALVELLFPELGQRPYLGRGGMAGVGVVALLGTGLIRILIPPSADPGYVLPLPALAVILALVGGLTFVALRVLPAKQLPSAKPLPVVRTDSATPAPGVVGVCCALTAFGFMALLFPFGGARQPAFTQGLWVLAPMLAAAVLGVGAALVLRRWSARDGWGDRHRLAAAGGAVLAHTAFGVVANAETTPDRVSLIAMGVLTAVLLTLLGRRLKAIRE